MPETQFDALAWLVAYLIHIYPDAVNIRNHSDIANTSCGCHSSIIEKLIEASTE
jgi:N-acetyl-anhydromuramyl-L-alanine amidase AmpD